MVKAGQPWKRNHNHQIIPLKWSCRVCKLYFNKAIEIRIFIEALFLIALPKIIKEEENSGFRQRGKRSMVCSWISQETQGQGPITNAEPDFQTSPDEP